MSNVLRGVITNPDKIYGKSAYEIAVMHGFDGTEEEWLDSLVNDVELRAEQAIADADAKIALMKATSASEQANIETTANEALTAIAEAKATMLEEIEVAGDIVQTTGCSETSVMAQGASSRSFANAIKGEESGGAVLCEEVSPVLHPVVVGVRSENLLNQSAFNSKSNCDVEMGENELLVTVTFNDPLWFYDTQRSILQPKSKYYFYAEADNGARVDLWVNRDRVYASGGYFEAPEAITNLHCELEGYEIGVTYRVKVAIYKVQMDKFIPFVPIGTAVKVTSAGENLIPFPYDFGDSTTIDGVTFVANSDDYITVNGVATRSIYMKIADVGALDGDCFISGCPAGGSDSTYNIIVDENDVGITRDYGSGAKFSASNGNTYSVVIYIPQGSAVSNLVFKPMLNLGPTALPREPYKAGQTIDTTVGSTIDLPSIAPYMSVYTNTEGTAVDVTYVKDTNAVVQKLVNAIVALGGNV